MLVAITGGVASGKSLALEIFKERGFSTFSADSIYHELIKDGEPLYFKLVQAFGESIVTNGEIDTKALSKIVFDSEVERSRLDSITHGAIMNKIAQLTRGLEVAIVEVPLLFECGMEKLFDKIIVVTASENIRLSRMKEHRGVSVAQAEKRIKSLIPDAEKIAKADIVLYNDMDIEEFKKKVQEVQI